MNLKDVSRMFAEAKKQEKLQAMKNQETLTNPQYLTKVLGFAILFGCFVKYEMGNRNHPKEEMK